MLRKIPAIIASSLLASMLAAGSAWAHAHLVSSIPADGAQLSAAPDSIAITLTEAIEPAFSHLKMTTASGEPVALTDETADGKAFSAKPSTPLPAGAYQVEWQVLSVDGHKTSGTFGFTVAP